MTSGLSDEALQTLRLVLLDVAERLYPDVYEAARPEAMIEPLRQNAGRLRDGFLELWRVAGFEGTPTSADWPPTKGDTL